MSKTITAPKATPVRVTRRRRRRGASRLEWVVVHLLFLIIVAFFVTPFLWLFSAAFDANAQAFIGLPRTPTLNNFAVIFSQFGFGRAMINSVFVATSTMIIVVLAVSMAGYSMARLEFRRKDILTYGILLLQTMPLAATMVPIYSLARELGLRNSYLGLILFHTAGELPFLTWMMKGFFDSVPRYLEEAAWLDGQSRLRTFFEIVLPVARPGLAVAAGLSFLDSWAEVLMVLILVDNPNMYTVPLAFYQALETNGGYTEVRYGLVAAMGLLYLLPVMIMFFATRKMMVRGLMNTTKGL